MYKDVIRFTLVVFVNSTLRDLYNISLSHNSLEAPVFSGEYLVCSQCEGLRYPVRSITSIGVVELVVVHMPNTQAPIDSIPGHIPVSEQVTSSERSSGEIINLQCP